MAARGAAGDRDERRIDSVLVRVVADPCDRALDVDRVVGPGRVGTEPVVHVEPDPAVRGQVVEQRDALLLACPRDPAAAVNLDDRRPGAHGGLVGQIDVELQRQRAVARIDDPALVANAAAAGHQEGEDDMAAREPGHVRLRIELGDGVPGGNRAAQCAPREGGAGEVGGDEHREADHTDHVIERAERDQHRCGDAAEDDQVRRELDRDPGGDPAAEDEPPAARGAKRVDDAERRDEAEGEEDERGDHRDYGIRACPLPAGRSPAPTPPLAS